MRRYWPLSVFFPFYMFAVVLKPSRPIVALMKVVGVCMLVVALCAVVGSMQNIIESWSSFTFFS